MEEISNPKNATVNQYVYRIFSFDYFVDLLVSGELTFVTPRLWDDPFENYILNNIEGYHIFNRCFFGQCWSFNRETDFMWRVYAPNKNGIKVKCNLEALKDHLINSKKCVDRNPKNLRLEKIKYVKKTELIKLWEDFNKNKDQRTDNWIRRPMETLFIKRWEFRHEKEFRIVYWDYNEQWNQESDPKKIIRWKIDVNQLIESISIDPRISEEQFHTWKSIIRKLGYNNKIFYSQLYKYKNISELTKIKIQSIKK